MKATSLIFSVLYNILMSIILDIFVNMRLETSRAIQDCYNPSPTFLTFSRITLSEKKKQNKQPSTKLIQLHEKTENKNRKKTHTK